MHFITAVCISLLTPTTPNLITNRSNSLPSLLPWPSLPQPRYLLIAHANSILPMVIAFKAKYRRALRHAPGRPDVALPVVWASVPLPPPVRAMYTATEGWGVFVTEGVGEVWGAHVCRATVILGSEDRVHLTQFRRSALLLYVEKAPIYGHAIQKDS